MYKQLAFNALKSCVSPKVVLLIQSSVTLNIIITIKYNHCVVIIGHNVFLHTVYYINITCCNIFYIIFLPMKIVA